MIVQELGDPGSGTPDIILPTITPRGAVVVINESPYGLDFYVVSAWIRVPAESQRRLRIPETQNIVQWRIAYTLPVNPAPLSDVLLEVYSCDEAELHGDITQLVRQTNVGNSVATTNTQVINDGNAAPIPVAEATPAGATGSHLLWNNDGSGIFGGGRASVDNHGIFTLPASAVPVASIGAGSVPAGVTVPGAQVSGSVASASSAGSAGSLTGSIAASQVNAGSFPAGSFTMDKIAFSGGGAITGLKQMTGSGSATVNHGISGLQAVVVNTFNGSNSTTYGSGSYTTTTCFVYQFNAQAWVALAYNG